MPKQVLGALEWKGQGRGVFDNPVSAGGTFIHEAIGHSLEVDHVQEGSSPAYRGMRGKMVAPETITVIDDPTLPFQRGSFAFDDEGVEARPTELVKNGVLTIATVMTVTVTCDHRVVDGATGARFLQAFKPLIEDPVTMLA